MFLTTSELSSKFEHRLSYADRVDIATAWATRGPVLDMLCKAAEESGLRVRAIVGTYGNATDPDALVRLDQIGKLRLVEGNGAMFHPKVYIFRGRRNRAWIGSANFTGAGFSSNEEAVYQTKNVDRTLKWFNRRWNSCDKLAPGAIEIYRERYQRKGMSKSLRGLVLPKTSGADGRVAYLEEVDDWNAYVRAVKKCDASWRHGEAPFSVTGETASYIHTIYEGQKIARCESWVGLREEEIKILLGLRGGVNGRWSLLGTLNPAKDVKRAFRESSQDTNRKTLKRVKDAIEEVIDAEDQDFPDVAVTALEKICLEYGWGSGAATRLLALARPDRLISVNSMSRDRLAEVFEVCIDSPDELGEPENYRLLLKRLYEAPWYSGPPGPGEFEQRIWSVRAALLDSFVYGPPRKAPGRS